MEKTGEFGWLRGMLFPIHRHEFRKFIPLTTIFCLLSMMYAMLRGLKEIFLLQHSTVEAMYFLKLFAVTPSMVLLTFLYSRISKLTNRDGRFNAVVGYFLAFFAIAHFFFIPHLEVLQLNKMADRLTVSMPSLHNLWEVLRIWPLSLLYIHAEGCVTMVWGVALWTFINEITHLEQSKRFYSLLGLGAEIGLISAGILLKYSKMGLNTLLSLVLAVMLLVLVVYNIFAYDIRRNPSQYQIVPKSPKPQVKRSFLGSLKFLAKSTYLLQLAIVVLLFGSSFTLFEAMWNTQIKILIENSSDSADQLTRIYGSQGIVGGCLSILFTFFVAPFMRRNWRMSASFTPVVTLVATMLFFGFLYFQEPLRKITAYWDLSPELLAVMFGMINISFIKSASYILFNPTKEQAYIPLDEEAKIHGKAVVDGVGLRLGRSLGSLILVAIVIPIFGPIQNAKACLFGIILAMGVLWLYIVKKLDLAYRKACRDSIS